MRLEIDTLSSVNIKRLEILTYLHISIPAPSAKLFLKYKALYMSEHNDDSLQICPSNDGSVRATPQVSLRSETSLQCLLLPEKKIMAVGTPCLQNNTQ